MQRPTIFDARSNSPVGFQSQQRSFVRINKPKIVYIVTGIVLLFFLVLALFFRKPGAVFESDFAEGRQDSLIENADSDDNTVADSNSDENGKFNQNSYPVWKGNYDSAEISQKMNSTLRCPRCPMCPKPKQSRKQGLSFFHSESKAKTLTFSSKKSLVAIPVGKKNSLLVDKVVQKFGFDDYDFVFFVWDPQADYRNMTWYPKVTWIEAHRQGKFWFAARFLHPDLVAGYEYLYLWDDDLDASDFDPHVYQSIIRNHSIDISSPCNKGFTIHTAMKCHQNPVPNQKTLGRLTNAVEIMSPVFSAKGWLCAYDLIQPDFTAGGFGYDNLWLQYCRLKMGVVDATSIRHEDTKALSSQSDWNYRCIQEMWELFRRFAGIQAENIFYTFKFLQ